MSLTDGDNWNQTRARRLQQSIPASYTIWNDGTNTYAESNVSGGTDYGGSTDLGGVDGADADAVIQAAINALSSPNGCIFLRGGTYGINVTLVTTANTYAIIGEPYRTVLQWTGGNTQVIIEAGASPQHAVFQNLVFSKSAAQTDITGLKFGAAAATQSRIIVDNCNFNSLTRGLDGGSGQPYGLYDSTVKDCLFYANTFGYDGYGSQVELDNCKFQQNTYGIRLSYSSATNIASAIGVNSVWSGSTYDIVIPTGTTEIRPTSFFGCWFESSVSGVISIADANTVIRTMTFEGCTFNTTNVAANSLLDFNNASGRVTINGCHNIRTTLTENQDLRVGAFCKAYVEGSIKTIQDGTYTDWIYNKNHGTTGAIATGTAVSHGLGTTPTSVIVTPAATGASDVYVDAFTTDHFHINFAGGGNRVFYWRAEV